MKKVDDLLYIGRADIARLSIGAEAMVDGIEALVRGCADGNVWNLPKSVTHPTPDRLFMSTLAVDDASGISACKALGLNNANSAEGIDNLNALITVFDSLSGQPLAILDGNWVTGVRTAALSAVAARFLAEPEASSIAFVGCGVQARSHLDVFAQLFPLTEVRAFGRGRANAERLCDQARALGLDAAVTATAQEAVSGARLIVSSVPDAPGFEPFLDAGWVDASAFVSMVDLSRSWRPETLSHFGEIFIEDLAQEATMATPMVPMENVAGDLFALVARRAHASKRAGAPSAFAFRGLALGDLALAQLVYRATKDNGYGVRLER